MNRKNLNYRPAGDPPSGGKTKNYSSAFSLVEMLVAMFIFVVIMVSVVGVFVSMVKIRKQSRMIQQQTEDIRGVMELMAKNLRMSAIDDVSASKDEIYAYNYSQGKCLHYVFDSGKKELKVGEFTTPREVVSGGTSIKKCNSYNNYTDRTVLSTGKVESFKVNNDPIKWPDNKETGLGKITISLQLTDSPYPIQTTVSLRDYSQVFQ